MKPIQIMMDDELLKTLDSSREVQAEGRSAVMRRAVAEYLARQRQAEIRARYERAYGAGPVGELTGWENEGVWPED